MKSKEVIDDYFSNKRMPDEARKLESFDEFVNPSFLLYKQHGGITVVTVKEFEKNKEELLVTKGGMESVHGSFGCYDSVYFQAIPSRHHKEHSRYAHLKLEDLAKREVYWIPD